MKYKDFKGGCYIRISAKCRPDTPPLCSESFVLSCGGKINCIIVKLMYFTVTTFATVGYGDIRPMTLMAHFIVTLEALFGIGCMSQIGVRSTLLTDHSTLGSSYIETVQDKESSKG